MRICDRERKAINFPFFESFSDRSDERSCTIKEFLFLEMPYSEMKYDAKGKDIVKNSVTMGTNIP